MSMPIPPMDDQTMEQIDWMSMPLPPPPDYWSDNVQSLWLRFFRLLGDRPLWTCIASPSDISSEEDEPKEKPNPKEKDMEVEEESNFPAFFYT